MRRGLKKGLLVALAVVLLSIPGSQTLVEATDAVKSAKTDHQQLIMQLDNLSGYQARRAGSKPPQIYAKSYLLMDAESSRVIVAQNANEKIPIASTTKMVTALVARELFELDEAVTVSRNAMLIPGSKIDLQAGEKITVLNLLKGLLIQSGNDAAFTLAYYYSKEKGQYQPFVAKMNEFAVAQNLKMSNFGDPAGLDDDTGRSTAFDLANIARLLLKDPVLAKIVVTPEETIASVDGALTHQLKNSNRLVVGDNPLYLPNVLGVKTGFTPAAGHCLVSAYRLGDRTFIGVVMNTAEYTITASASEMRKLFKWADQNVLAVKY